MVSTKRFSDFGWDPSCTPIKIKMDLVCMRSNVFSLGCIIDIIFREHPFGPENNRESNIESGLRTPNWIAKSTKLTNLVLQMTERVRYFLISII